MTLILISLITAAMLSWGIIRIMCPIAIKVGLVDNPDKLRKLHQTAIPLVGGISIFLAILVVVPLIWMLEVWANGLFQTCDTFLSSLSPWELPTVSIGHFRRIDLFELGGLVLASSLLLAVGVADDWLGIRGRHKLIGQIAAITILILFGYQFKSVQFAGINIQFGVFAGILIYGWMLAAINSVNLLDGADGIATTIGIIMSLALGAMMVVQGKGVDSLVMFAIAGSLLAFLSFNFPPAKVYLGDAGSMLIGFLLAAMAVRSTFKQNSLYAFMAPVTLLTIPFIDTAAAIIRRRMTGRSIFAVDRGHLHHELLKQGYSPVASIVWVALFCTITAVGGVIALIQKQAEIALIAIALVFVMMAGAKLFGWAELKLVSRKSYSLVRSLLPSQNTAKMKSQIKEATYHVQGDRDWQAWWELLRDYASKNDFLDLTMDLNAPWLHESFHAKMKGTSTVRESNYIWTSSVPLVYEDRIFGKVDFSCSKDSASHHDIIHEILEITKSIEFSMRDDSATQYPTHPENEDASADQTPSPGRPLLSDLDDSGINATNESSAS
jgi:UDP-GlcNAc:undecaprenyl-phosphate GlcNAc-1-phosphate transferase